MCIALSLLRETGTGLVQKDGREMGGMGGRRDPHLDVSSEKSGSKQARHRTPQQCHVSIDRDSLLCVGRSVEGIVRRVVRPDHERSEQAEDVRLVAACGVLSGRSTDWTEGSDLC